jgi:hypothetical protein
MAGQFYRSDASWAEVYKNPQFVSDAVKRPVRHKWRPAHWTGDRGGSVYTSEDGGPRLMRSVIYARSEHGRAGHPTQKLLTVIEPLLLYSCSPGGHVLPRRMSAICPPNLREPSPEAAKEVRVGSQASGKGLWSPWRTLGKPGPSNRGVIFIGAPPNPRKVFKISFVYFTRRPVSLCSTSSQQHKTTPCAPSIKRKGRYVPRRRRVRIYPSFAGCLAHSRARH